MFSCLFQANDTFLAYSLKGKSEGLQEVRIFKIGKISIECLLLTLERFYSEIQKSANPCSSLKTWWENIVLRDLYCTYHNPIRSVVRPFLGLSWWWTLVAVMKRWSNNNSTEKIDPNHHAAHPVATSLQGRRYWEQSRTELALSYTESQISNSLLHPLFFYFPAFPLTGFNSGKD